MNTRLGKGVGLGSDWSSESGSADGPRGIPSLSWLLICEMGEMEGTALLGEVSGSHDSSSGPGALAADAQKEQ